jgi:hypothetical protein
MTWMVLASLAAAACASTQVSSFLESGVDLYRYHAYSWGPPDAAATGDPRLDNNEFFRNRMQAQVDTHLAAQGFERVESGADLLVHYHVSVTQRIDVNRIDQQYGYCDSCRPQVYDAGTLTLDLVDARLKRLVWRGWAIRSFDGVLDRQEWMEKQIDDAVARIFARLPVPLAAARATR